MIGMESVWTVCEVLDEVDVERAARDTERITHALRLAASKRARAAGANADAKVRQ